MRRSQAEIPKEQKSPHQACNQHPNSKMCGNISILDTGILSLEVWKSVFRIHQLDINMFPKSILP